MSIQTRRLVLGPIVAFAIALIALGATASPALAGTPGSVRVTDGNGYLNVRKAPNTNGAPVDRLKNETRLDIACKVTGMKVSNKQYTTDQWDQLVDGRYVSHAYVGGAATLPLCGAPQVKPQAPTLAPMSSPPAKPTVRTEGGALNIRNGPSTVAAIVGAMANGTEVTIVCQVKGPSVSWPQKTSDLWDRLPSGNYVSDAYVTTAGSAAPCPMSAPVTAPAGPVPSLTNAEFITAAAKAARLSQAEFGIPASVTIAQAIIESGWGRSKLSVNDRNYFGIKCFPNNIGLAVGCHDYETTECLPACFKTTASFRVYPSIDASFRDHALFLTGNSRYKRAFAYTKDANQFLYQVWKGGYATSPTYYDDVTAIMKRYNLYQYNA
jgi:uncharacterized protein YraI